ncbi:MAG: DUF2252 family protein [Myxococcota bacterium]
MSDRRGQSSGKRAMEQAMLAAVALHRTALCVLMLVGCPRAHEVPAAPIDPPSAPRPPERAELTPDASFLSSPTLRERVSASAHNYFRAINTPFAHRVCDRFESVIATMPSVNLHGDAHFEQLAVTDGGGGFADFDDSVSGPPVIDLVRFGVSLELAAHVHDWSTEELIDAFLDAYAARGDADDENPLPVPLERLREAFPVAPEAFLEASERRMAGDLALSGLGTDGFARYVDLMARLHPTWAQDFFTIKRAGSLLEEGIGSATTRRALIRIEGPSTADEDDRILEAKEMRDVSSIRCVGGRGLSLQVVASGMRFGAHEDPFLAIVPRAADEGASVPPWWVQSWWPNYSELTVDAVMNEADGRAVAAFAGRTLHDGHTGMMPRQQQLQLRSLLESMMASHRPAIERAITALAYDVRAAFGAFRAEAAD